MQTPSAIGAVLGMIQLTVYFIYRNSRKLIVSPVSTKDLSQAQQIDMHVVELSQTKQVDMNALDVTVIKIETEKSKCVTVASIDLIVADEV